jgi:hypothetical protein
VWSPIWNQPLREPAGRALQRFGDLLETEPKPEVSASMGAVGLNGMAAQTSFFRPLVFAFLLHLQQS